VTPDHPNGTHSSRSVLIRPDDFEPLHLRLFLHQAEHPRGLPVLLCVEGYDEDPPRPPTRCRCCC
jgi:hypothetical protein